ncbi:hypothetical protein KJ940_00815, partial [Myxococcota bacterium]|nr:hypothetical protein [Myxococcota bacterium]
MDQEPPPKHIIIIYNNDDASDSIKESGCPISPQETVELDYRGKKARAEVIDVALLIKKTINQIDKRIKVSLYSVESIFTLKK